MRLKPLAAEPRLQRETGETTPTPDQCFRYPGVKLANCSVHFADKAISSTIKIVNTKLATNENIAFMGCIRKEPSPRPRKKVLMKPPYVRISEQALRARMVLPRGQTARVNATNGAAVC